jgi:hypothetical protein
MTTGTVSALPPQRLSLRRRRQAARQAKIRRRVGPALYQVMEPGEQILAGTFGWTGHWGGWDSIGAAAGLAFGTAGVPLHLFDVPAGMLLAAFPSLLLNRRRYVFLAVTDRQLICLQTYRSGWPHKVLFRTARETVQMRGGPRRRLWRSVRYLGLDTKTQDLRLSAGGAWRQDLDDLVGILQAAGIPVDGYIPGGLPATVQVLLP